ncbi:hypothetical protein SAGO17_00100 [Mimivirus AB-566-O17]|uniref:Uncharacterized protein n=1 Tax=Mimivirus AB-566-O17 TaxID=1988039 RepID=A0A1X9VNX6_9VIRU|nr:hypothetical protein SAGO17_00100 [Mimivirus AB-566-O17]
MDVMETQIESLPGSDNIQIPPSIERALDEPIPRMEVPSVLQMEQPNVSYSIAKKESTFDISKQVLSKEFALLIVMLLVVDSRYLNVLITRYVPIGMIKSNNLVKTLLKVGVVALVFVLVRHYFIK